MSRAPTACTTVLFDVDGTLVDSREVILRTYTDAVRDVEGDPTADPVARLGADRMLQMPASAVFTLLAADDPERTRRIADSFQRRYAERRPRWFPGALEAVRALHEDGLRLAIVTSKSRRRLDEHLAAVGASAMFAAAICAEDVRHTKPDPEPVTAALARLGTAPGTAALVGDGPDDVKAARAAGVASIGVAYGFHPRECRAAAPDHWLEDLRDLPGLVGAIGTRR